MAPESLLSRQLPLALGFVSPRIPAVCLGEQGSLGKTLIPPCRLYTYTPSRHAARIRSIALRFDNVVIAACRNTMARLRREQGILVKWIPEAGGIEAGVVAVVKRRRRDGRIYVSNRCSLIWRRR